MTKRCHMRIAMLSAEFPPQPGGVGDYTAQLGNALVSRDHSVAVLTAREHRWSIIRLQQDVSEHRTIDAPFNRSIDWGWEFWQPLTASLVALQPDVLHIQYQTGAYGMHPAINLLPARLRRTLARPRIVVTAHDLLEPYLFPKAGPLRRLVTKRLLCDADAAIVTNVHDAATMHERGWPQAATIPIGSNIPILPIDESARAATRAQLGAVQGELLIGYFGLMGRSKGIETLLDALAQLPQARLAIIGGAATQSYDQAYAAAIEAQIAALGLRDRIHITGQLAPEAVSAALQAADVVALPFSDGASFRRGSLLAALTHGLPIVTTIGGASVGHSETHLVDGESALLVAPGDAAALARAIRRLADDAVLRKRVAAGGQQLAAQFSWPQIAERHAALYDQLLREQVL